MFNMIKNILCNNAKEQSFIKDCQEMSIPKKAHRVKYDYEFNKIAQKLFWAINTRLDENFQYIANTKLGKRKITLRSFGSQNNLIYHNEFNHIEFVLESYNSSTYPRSSIHCKTIITKEQANLALYELEELLE